MECTGNEDTATSGQQGPSPCTGPASLGHPGYDVRLTVASLKVPLNTSGAGASSRRTARGPSGYHDANRACVQARLSIVFAGHPGAGETTLMSCTAAELDPALRVVVAEEVFEADIPLPNVAHMQTRAARSDREPVDLRRLVAGFLRMAPDVAIVGEVRHREGLPENPPHDCRAA